MALENGSPVASVEFDAVAREPLFNFEFMSLDVVRTVHRVLFEAANDAWDACDGSGPDWEQMEIVTEAFYGDLERLPYRNIERARELILSLARSERAEDRYAAAIPLCWLLRRECELDTEDVAEQVDLIAQLVHNYDGLTSGDIFTTVGEALRERWWPEPVATLVQQATAI